MTAAASFNTTALDQALSDLRAGAPTWVAMPLKDKVSLLEALPHKILDLGPQMVAAANKVKGISPTSAWAGEDWLANVWAFIQGVNSHAYVLKRVLAGNEPIPANAVHTRPNDQVLVDVFPVTGYDRLLLSS